MVLPQVLKMEILTHQKSYKYLLQRKNNSFIENRYFYQYKDHLKNTRVSFGRNSE